MQSHRVHKDFYTNTFFRSFLLHMPSSTGTNSQSRINPTVRCNTSSTHIVPFEPKIFLKQMWRLDDDTRVVVYDSAYDLLPTGSFALLSMCTAAPSWSLDSCMTHANTSRLLENAGIVGQQGQMGYRHGRHARRRMVFCGCQPR